MKSQIGKAKKTRGKSYHTHLHKERIPLMIEKIIQESDIIIEVLDARFIEKTRNVEVEEKVKKFDKKIIYIFNKSDLVDIDKIKRDVELWEMKPGLFFSAQERKGSSALRKLIKIEASKVDKDVVDVGIVGYPNTGKSSIINLLVGKRVSGTSPEAGYTKGIQKIKISEGIYVIDTPGVIPSMEKSMISKGFFSKHTQIGAMTWDKAKNPEVIVSKIVEGYPNVLENYYKIDAEGDSEILIEMLGKKLNYLKKGGEIDEIRTSKKILKDWQEGKIRF